MITLGSPIYALTSTLTLNGVLADGGSASGLTLIGAGGTTLTLSNPLQHPLRGPIVIDGSLNTSTSVANTTLATTYLPSTGGITLNQSILSYTGPSRTINNGFTIEGAATGTVSKISVIAGSELTMTGALGSAGNVGAAVENWTGNVDLESANHGSSFLAYGFRDDEGTMVLDGVPGTVYTTQRAESASSTMQR